MTNFLIFLKIPPFFVLQNNKILNFCRLILLLIVQIIINIFENIPSSSTLNKYFKILKKMYSECD